MSVTVIMSLDPGRYQVRGGPRGDMVIQRVMLDYDSAGKSVDRGRVVIRNTARDRWPVLATFRVRAGG